MTKRKPATAAKKKKTNCWRHLSDETPPGRNAGTVGKCFPTKAAAAADALRRYGRKPSGYYVTLPTKRRRGVSGTATAAKFCVREWSAQTDGSSKRVECHATKAAAEAAMHRLYRGTRRAFIEDQIGGPPWFVAPANVAPKGNPYYAEWGKKFHPGLLRHWGPKGIKPLRRR